MKKYLVSVILVSAILIGATGNVYGYYSQEGWESSAIKQLENLDIVRNAKNRWDKTDYITRRDAFKIAFIIKEYRRDYYDDEISVGGDYDWFERSYLSNCKITWYYDRKFDFQDLERGSDDYFLMANLFITGLSAGREENGELFAKLDDPLTYNEAFATILRMTMENSGVEASLLEKI